MCVEKLLWIKDVIKICICQTNWRIKYKVIRLDRHTREYTFEIYVYAIYFMMMPIIYGFQYE